jgi:hypothetical protein
MNAPPCKKDVKKSFYNILKKISKEYNGDSFTGIGMTLYQTGSFSEKNHCDLRPSIPCPKNVSLEEEGTVKVLLEIADCESPLHDGFVFFNEKGVLTHISQYFVPPPVDDIIPNESYGTRYHSAQFGSLIEGVILTGVLCCDREPHLFEKGKEVRY